MCCQGKSCFNMSHLGFQRQNTGFCQLSWFTILGVERCMRSEARCKVAPYLKCIWVSS
jgi:hypothetical protein